MVQRVKITIRSQITVLMAKCLRDCLRPITRTLAYVVFFVVMKKPSFDKCNLRRQCSRSSNHMRKNIACLKQIYKIPGISCDFINPFFTGRLFHCYMLDGFIYHFRGVKSSLSLSFCF